MEERDKFTVPFKLEKITLLTPLLVLHNQVKNIAKFLFFEQFPSDIIYSQDGTQYVSRRKIVTKCWR